MATSDTSTPTEDRVNADLRIGKGISAQQLQDYTATSSSMATPFAEATPIFADSATSTPTTPIPEQDDDDSIFEVFRFFDLPREMRNMIYESVEPETFNASLPCRLTLKGDAKCANLLAVSKQFRKEYEESIAIAPQYLTISDVYTNTFDFYDKWILPAQAKRSTHVEINLESEVDEGPTEELQTFGTWVPFLLKQLPKLKVLSLRLDVMWEYQVKEFKYRINRGFWTQIPTLKRFDIYQSTTYDTGNFEAGEKTLLVEFSPEKKRMVNAASRSEWREVVNYEDENGIVRFTLGARNKVEGDIESGSESEDEWF